MRKRALLAFSLPLAAAGTLAGHTAGYALVGVSRRDALAHGYLGYAPQFLALCVAVLALALALRVTGRLQGRPAAWPFALIPPIAFLAQELIERLAAGLPAHAVLEPAVYVGLAVQLPIALAAFLAARVLVRVADEAAQTLAPPRSFALRPVPLSIAAPQPSPAAARLALDRLGRAPPR
ncbi:MAG TPA: hypothetical protein VH760_03400 [Gaiellaceae bacterium]